MRLLLFDPSCGALESRSCIIGNFSFFFFFTAPKIVRFGIYQSFTPRVRILLRLPPGPFASDVSCTPLQEVAQEATYPEVVHNIGNLRLLHILRRFQVDVEVANYYGQSAF